MQSKQLIGLDIGRRRTGIARASDTARLAQPLMTVSTEDLIAKLTELINEYSVDKIVVGLPRSIEGNDTDQTRMVRRWAARAKLRINKPFFWQDEALTSKTAESKARPGKSSQNESLDALAAAYILQDFLDTPETERVVC